MAGNKGLGFFRGLMEGNIRDCGLMENSMDLELIPTLMELILKVFGVMGSLSGINGLTYYKYLA